jgi:aspartate/glutamate racemase
MHADVRAQLEASQLELSVAAAASRTLLAAVLCVRGGAAAIGNSAAQHRASSCEHARSLGLKNVGLFGTRFTMQADFYPAEFRRAEIAVTRAKASEQEFIHEKYLNELLNGTFLPETRAEVLRIARRMKAEEGTEAVILAGTELPLLLRDAEAEDIQFLDTTEIHVEAVVDELLR